MQQSRAVSILELGARRLRELRARRQRRRSCLGLRIAVAQVARWSLLWSCGLVRLLARRICSRQRVVESRVLCCRSCWRLSKREILNRKFANVRENLNDLQRFKMKRLHKRFTKVV